MHAIGKQKEQKELNGPTLFYRKNTDKRRRKNNSKGVQNKSTPNFFRYNTFSLGCSISNISLIDYYIDSFTLDFTKGILDFLHETPEFVLETKAEGIDLIKEISCKILSEGYIIYYNQDCCDEDDVSFKVYKDYKKHSHDGYGSSLYWIYDLKHKRRTLYKYLINLLRVLSKSGKVVMYYDTYEWDYTKEVNEPDFYDEDDDIELLDFKKPDKFMRDIINSDMNDDDIFNILNLKRYSKYHELFKTASALLNTNGSVYDYCINLGNESQPFLFCLLFWNFGSDIGECFQQTIDMDMQEKDWSWYRIPYGKDSTFLDNMFNLLNTFISYEDI